MHIVYIDCNVNADILEGILEDNSAHFPRS